MASEAFQSVRSMVKESFKAQDVALLILWLLVHFQDDGKIRSPQMPRRKRIVLEGVSYVLVREPESKL
jgi:hypothetical protein